jgi:hypothetical protein
MTARPGNGAWQGGLLSSDRDLRCELVERAAREVDVFEVAALQGDALPCCVAEVDVQQLDQLKAQHGELLRRTDRQ